MLNSKLNYEIWDNLGAFSFPVFMIFGSSIKYAPASWEAKNKRGKKQLYYIGLSGGIFPNDEKGFSGGKIDGTYGNAIINLCALIKTKIKLKLVNCAQNTINNTEFTELNYNIRDIQRAEKTINLINESKKEGL